MLAPNAFWWIVSNSPCCGACPARCALDLAGDDRERPEQGKDLTAKLIHDKSGRTGPIIPINCANFGEGIIESELFGHERGAFTRAVSTISGFSSEQTGELSFLTK